MKKVTVYELVIFSILGALMYATKVAMEFLPNIHLLGMFIMTFTIVFRKKALIPLYIYIFLDGLLSGFSLWWIPYLYIWTVLWGVTMLLPKKMPVKVAIIVYPVVCSLHGLSFGALYAPAYALMFRMSLKQTVAWILSGIPFDAIHAVSNLFMGMLVLPFSQLLKKLTKEYLYVNE